jgi:hypothetical protein
MEVIDYQECADQWGFTVEEMEQHEICALGRDYSQQCQV